MQFIFAIPFWNQETLEKVSPADLDPATVMELSIPRGANVILRLMHEGRQVGYSELAITPVDSLQLGPFTLK